MVFSSVRVVIESSTTSRRFFAGGAVRLGLAIHPLPFHDIGFRMTMIFHPYSAHDPAIMWLCERLRAVAKIGAQV